MVGAGLLAISGHLFEGLALPLPIQIIRRRDRSFLRDYDFGQPVELRAYRAIVRTLEDFWLGAAALPRREGHSEASAIGYGY